MGAWIETGINQAVCLSVVAPYMGAWIETLLYAQRLFRQDVAPYMGAWIETNWQR